jgi:hypothetical protein
MAQAQRLTWGAGLDRAVGTDRRARPDPASARPRAGTGQDTLTSLLDRLETGGLIIRSLDPHDRRARIPQVTTAGRRTQARITRARDHTEAELLTTFSPQEQHLLRDLLTRLAADQRGDCLHAHLTAQPSCHGRRREGPAYSATSPARRAERRGRRRQVAQGCCLPVARGSRTPVGPDAGPGPDHAPAHSVAGLSGQTRADRWRRRRWQASTPAPAVSRSRITLHLFGAREALRADSAR